MVATLAGVFRPTSDENASIIGLYRTESDRNVEIDMEQFPRPGLCIYVVESYNPLVEFEKVDLVRQSLLIDRAYDLR